MEKDFFHVQRTALRNDCRRNVIAMQGKFHQLYQLTDMVKVRGSNLELMVTGSDDPVTQCATLRTWSTLHITLQYNVNLFINNTRGLNFLVIVRFNYNSCNVLVWRGWG